MSNWDLLRTLRRLGKSRVGRGFSGLPYPGDNSITSVAAGDFRYCRGGL